MIVGAGLPGWVERVQASQYNTWEASIARAGAGRNVPLVASRHRFRPLSHDMPVTDSSAGVDES